MNPLRRTGSALSLLAWLLPGAVAHGLVLHVAAEHSIHARHGHDSDHAHGVGSHSHEAPDAHPHAHAARAHSHDPAHDGHPRDHHEEMTILLASPSTSTSRILLASEAIVLRESALLAPSFEWRGRLPEPVPPERAPNPFELLPVLRI